MNYVSISNVLHQSWPVNYRSVFEDEHWPWPVQDCVSNCVGSCAPPNHPENSLASKWPSARDPRHCGFFPYQNGGSFPSPSCWGGLVGNGITIGSVWANPAMDQGNESLRFYPSVDPVEPELVGLDYIVPNKSASYPRLRLEAKYLDEYDPLWGHGYVDARFSVTLDGPLGPTEFLSPEKRVFAAGRPFDPPATWITPRVELPRASLGVLSTHLYGLRRANTNTVFWFEYFEDDEYRVEIGDQWEEATDVIERFREYDDDVVVSDGVDVMLPGAPFHPQGGEHPDRPSIESIKMKYRCRRVDNIVEARLEMEVQRVGRPLQTFDSDWNPHAAGRVSLPFGFNTQTEDGRVRIDGYSAVRRELLLADYFAMPLA